MARHQPSMPVTTARERFPPARGVANLRYRLYRPPVRGWKAEDSGLRLFETYDHYRQIFLDSRLLPEAVQPAYMGYSVGKWDSDTLVVETTGFNDRGWLDDGGHPQTESLHVKERFRRTNFGHISLQLTIDDARAYTKPWTVNLSRFNFLADEELMESICENEKDVPHMVGK